MKDGIEPLMSSNVCNLIAPLVDLNFAQGNIDKHKSIVVESNAYTVFLRLSEKTLSNY